MSHLTDAGRAALACQVLLLAYHQLTTLVDLHPFNGVRSATRGERLAEAGVNAILMSLAPIGFALGIHGLMLYGVIYYFVLFFFELVIWWVPYLSVPSGRWLRVYNFLLSIATTSFGETDPLANWTARHVRLHSSTLTLLPPGRGPIVPNLEHTILHAWTALTAIATLAAFLAQPAMDMDLMDAGAVVGYAGPFMAALLVVCLMISWITGRARSWAVFAIASVIGIFAYGAISGRLIGDHPGVVLAPFFVLIALAMLGLVLGIIWRAILRRSKDTDAE